MKTKKSWVWRYAHREGEVAFCDLCSADRNNAFSCRGGSTGSLLRHLRGIHGVLIAGEVQSFASNDCSLNVDEEYTKDNQESSQFEVLDPTPSKKAGRPPKRRNKKVVNTLLPSEDIQEEIHQPLSYSVPEVDVTTVSFEGDVCGTPEVSIPDEFQLSAFTDNSVNSGEEHTEDNNESSVSEALKPYSSKKRKIHEERPESIVHAPLNSEEKQEEIQQALTRMIVLNQMPLAFCSSKGFLQFMAVVEPNYTPVKEEAIKKQLQSMRHDAEKVIRVSIARASGVSWSSNFWNSATQASYLAVAAHLIDSSWVPRSFTLETSEIDKRHTEEYVQIKTENILFEWGLPEKIMAAVTDNPANIVKTESMEQVQKEYNLTCAAHSLQLAVNESLSSDYIQSLIGKASKIVEHFKHSNVAKYALEEKQIELGLPLLQSCTTGWTSVCKMLQGLIKNRGPVINVLADLTATSSAKLEISEQEWTSFEELANVLQPVQLLNNLLSAQDSPASMIRPLIYKMLEMHMVISENESDIVRHFKSKFTKDIRERLNLQWDRPSHTISIIQVASLLDPRYKDLEHEDYRVRPAIREELGQLLREHAPTESTTTSNISHTSTQIALEFIYKTTVTSRSDVKSQLEAYFIEPQLRFDLNPFEWWKYRADKYPAIAHLAQMYLCIPATSISAERCFSTVGGISNLKELPENADLVFLYQNRNIIPQLDCPTTFKN